MIFDRFRTTPPGSTVGRPLPERVSIFVTVGTELPFDRLVRAVDDWAGRDGRGADVFAQIGDTEFVPRHVRWGTTLSGMQHRRLFDQADLVIAHAGMGTIIAALQKERPLVVVPRRAELGEHRNDHQLATVSRLAERGLVNVAKDERDLIAYLDGRTPIEVAQRIDGVASAGLIEGIRRTIREA